MLSTPPKYFKILHQSQPGFLNSKTLSCWKLGCICPTVRYNVNNFLRFKTKQRHIFRPKKTQINKKKKKRRARNISLEITLLYHGRRSGLKQRYRNHEYYSFSTRSNNQIIPDKRPGTLMACQFGSLELKNSAIYIQNCAAVPRLIQC